MAECGVWMSPGGEDENGDPVDTQCHSERPCSSHQYKQHAILRYPEHVIHIRCPKCKASEGPGGMCMLTGELSYGSGRWPCKCGYTIPGVYFRDSIQYFQ